MRTGARRRAEGRAWLTCAALLCAASASAQEPPPQRQASMNLFGVTGLIDMPSARSQPDGELSLSASSFGGFTRTTLNFQVLPRLEATFRYSVVEDFFSGDQDLFDRSFDLKFRFSDETALLPAFAFGLQDFLGTGIYSAEYFAATKTVLPGLEVTGGFGWGRFAGEATLPNPFCELRGSFCTREGTGGGTGDVRVGRFFRGEDIGFFGGVEYRPPQIPALGLKAEFSSDTYAREKQFSDFEQEIPVNFGMEYRVSPGLALGAYAMYGTEVGLRATISANPSRPTATQNAGPAPRPLRARPQATATSEALGPVTEAIGAGPALGSDAGAQAAILAGATQGARWAEARLDVGPDAACPVDAARDIDARLGVVDGVTFLDSDGDALCSVVLRPAGRAYVAARAAAPPPRPTAWADDPAQLASVEARVRRALAEDAIGFEGLTLEGGAARLSIVNAAYNAAPQAIGRAAVALANNAPASVERFEITVIEGTLPIVAVKLDRRRLEAAAEAPDRVQRSFMEAEIADAAPIPFAELLGDASYPRFGWFLTPAVPVNLFDPDQPLRADLRLRAGGTVELARGISFNGAVGKRIVGQLDDIERTSNSRLPRVRSDIAKYLRQGDPSLDRLTFDVMSKLDADVYGRVSFGLLEAMYGGLSAEVLWKPVSQDWGLGLEANYVKQRDFNMRLDFLDYEVATGHASLYWDTGWKGFEVQVDAGRYLAGDWGGTFSLTRTFANGWEVGGFFTLTDVPFDEFGEGSFDKGLRLTIPLRWGLPFENRSRIATELRPLTRDGGARLSVAGRLHTLARELDRSDLREDWGAFWQ